MSNPRITESARRMDGTIEVLNRELSGLRTGRASINLLDSVKVDAYGTPTPINQIGNINVPEARMLTVQVWDNSMIKSTEKAIRDAGLGLNPAVDGQLIRIPLPPLNEERRQELTKIAAKYAEEARISVRNVRRDAMEALKKSEKDGDISEDEHRRLSDEVQKVTDAHIKKIDEVLALKQKDILQV
ncbi:ribosome recycling factor [Candidatus Odyssella acanthamoebae]|uniref:Ribosome-recycling factor n=1 Tax=Candidatus Odyssella acanthamoebae TaxID=91604 RepID=A0A077AWS7_9PROT|nr:ribosome recycling factor [Candidatus Paracaedibacter acanthamoebae]AIK96439.1 ribosome-recycling factor [Candidatus Paracaedibacter acanthamoebae]